MQFRDSSGTTLVSTATAASAPRWVRVTRAGNVFSGFVSADSVTWSLVSSQTISMGNDLQACMGSSSNSASLSADTIYDSVSVVPAPWLPSDIGSLLTGYATFYNNQYRLVSAGAGIGGTSDQGLFLCRQITGDATITARVVSAENVGAVHQAGVMFRESLIATSKYSYMYMASSGAGYHYYRAATSGGTTAAIASFNIPYWVRITKSGNVYSPFVSANGVTWTPIGAVTIPMGTSPYVCLVSSSRNVSARGESIFESVTVV